MTKKVIVLVLIMISSSIFAENDEMPFEIKKVKDDFIVNYIKDGKTIEVYRSYKDPIIQNLKNKYFLIILPCGSPCFYATFINDNDGNVSKPFFLLIAYDTYSKRVLYSEKDHIILQSMFDESYIKPISLNFSPTVSPFTVIKDAILTKDNLSFTYLSGEKYTEKPFNLRLSN